MAENNFQKDFFNDYFGGKKDRKAGFIGGYLQQRHLPYVRIPIEYTVIISIGVLVLMIVFYALGVEQGKKTTMARFLENPEMSEAQEAGKPAEKKVVITVDTDDIKDDQQSKEMSGDTESLEVSENVGVEETIPPEVEKEPLAVEPGFGYTLQLASFRKERSAEEEIKKLKLRGMKTGVSKRGKWYQIYVEGYQSKKEAQKAMSELLVDYKDCFIRKVRESIT